MRKFWILSVVAAVALTAGLGSFAQAPAGAQKTDAGITANGVIGDVVAVDAGSKQVFVKTDAGSVVIVSVADATKIMRNPPGATGLDKAVPMALSEITAGDRVFARGPVSEDRKTLAAARALIVNTKAELEAKREAERAEWKRRGVVGVVSAVNLQTKEITLQTRGPQGPQPVVIAASGEAVKFRRYAPDSVKFGDAKPSAFDEVKVGDQLRAKGERSADGARFTPEEVVTGTFRTAVGTVTAVDAAKGELTIKQMQGDKPLTVVVRPDSMLRRIPPEVAAMLGGMGGPGGPGGAPGAGGPGQQRVVVQGGPGAGSPGQGGPGAGGPGGGGQRRMMGDMSEMLERLPAATLADLKPGEMIVVSSTVGADPTRVTAIQLVAGVEQIMAMMARRMGGAAGAGGMGAGAGAGAGLGFGFGIGQP